MGKTSKTTIQESPFLSRPVREIKFLAEHPRLVFYRNIYNGAWQSADIVGKLLKPAQVTEFQLPDNLYVKVK